MKSLIKLIKHIIYILIILVCLVLFVSIWFTSESDNFIGSAELERGNMYAEGNGVLLDLDKAIDFYKKAALQGNPTAAYNICVTYDKKSEGYSEYDDNNRSIRKRYKIQAHAWLRVAAALGHKKVTLINGDTKHISEQIRTERHIFGSLGWLAEADRKSIEICKQVSGCNL